MNELFVEPVLQTDIIERVIELYGEALFKNKND